MDENKAIELKKKIQELCEKYGAWCEPTEKRSPKLAHIAIKINIKVT